MNLLKIVVTGAVHPGIGKSIIEKLVESGSASTVGLIGKMKDASTDNFIKECRTIHSCELRFFETDITNPSEIESSVQKFASVFDGIDCAIHAANVMLPMGACHAEAQARYLLSEKVNHLATFAFATAVRPFLAQSSDPRFLNISPPIGFVPRAYSGKIAYVVSQYARSMVTTALAHDPEWIKDRIQANCLWPLRPSEDCNVSIYQPHMERSKREKGLKVMAQAAYHLLTAPRGKFTPNGECLYDEELLEIAGIDFQEHSFESEHVQPTPGMYQQHPRTRMYHYNRQKQAESNNLYHNFNELDSLS